MLKLVELEESARWLSAVSREAKEEEEGEEASIVVTD